MLERNLSALDHVRFLSPLQSIPFQGLHDGCAKDPFRHSKTNWVNIRIGSSKGRYTQVTAHTAFNNESERSSAPLLTAWVKS